MGTSERGAVKLPSAAALSGWELSSLHGAKLGSRGLGRRWQQEGPPGWADSLWGALWRAGAEWFCTGHADLSISLYMIEDSLYIYAYLFLICF